MAKVEEKRAELTEHLTELRARLIRSIVYLVAGTIIAWYFYDWLYFMLTKPLQDVLYALNTKPMMTSITEPFMIKMQICLVAGLIIMSPMVVMEVWGFISPGLTRHEKRPLMWTIPLAVILFLAGITLCYSILPMGFRWFASYIPKGADLRPSLMGSILFTAKMLLAFGVVFELPILLMLLAKVGIVNAKMLKENWRTAMVVVSIIAAVATPSNDALTMLMMAVPVAILYFLSIGLVKVVEKKSLL